MVGNKASHHRIVVLIALTASATLGLHTLGRTPGLAIDWARPLGWIDSSKPSDVVGAIFRLIGLGIGWWVLVTMVLYYAAGLLVGHRRRPRWLTLITLPPVRKVIDRVLATSLALSIAATPVGPLRTTATTAPERTPVVYELTGDGIPVPHVGSAAPLQSGDGTDDATVPAPVSDQTAPPEPVPVTPPSAMVPSASPIGATSVSRISDQGTYTVVVGDNLWEISATRLETVLGTPPTEAEIRQYWQAVIAANRPTLRSGDPNLIYPGELVTLPVAEVSR